MPAGLAGPGRGPEKFALSSKTGLAGSGVPSASPEAVAGGGPGNRSARGPRCPAWQDPPTAGVGFPFFLFWLTTGGRFQKRTSPRPLAAGGLVLMRAGRPWWAPRDYERIHWKRAAPRSPLRPSPLRAAPSALRGLRGRRRQAFTDGPGPPNLYAPVWLLARMRVGRRPPRRLFQPVFLLWQCFRMDGRLRYIPRAPHTDRLQTG